MAYAECSECGKECYWPARKGNRLKDFRSECCGARLKGKTAGRKRKKRPRLRCAACTRSVEYARFPPEPWRDARAPASGFYRYPRRLPRAAQPPPYPADSPCCSWHTPVPADAPEAWPFHERAAAIERYGDISKIPGDPDGEGLYAEAVALRRAWEDRVRANTERVRKEAQDV